MLQLRDIVPMIALLPGSRIPEAMNQLQAADAICATEVVDTHGAPGGNFVAALVAVIQWAEVRPSQLPKWDGIHDPGTPLHGQLGSPAQQQKSLCSR